MEIRGNVMLVQQIRHLKKIKHNLYVKKVVVPPIDFRSLSTLIHAQLPMYKPLVLFARNFQQH